MRALDRIAELDIQQNNNTVEDHPQAVPPRNSFDTPSEVVHQEQGSANAADDGQADFDDVDEMEVVPDSEEEEDVDKDDEDDEDECPVAKRRKSMRLPK